MTTFEFSTLMLSVMTVFVVPLFVLVIRGVVKWTKIENAVQRVGERIEVVATDLKEFMKEKEKSHNLIYQQMTNDREATDRRLRWLEENTWKGGKGNAI